LRKLSGELTTIQNWLARPSVLPDLRLRRLLPDFAGPASAAAGCSSVNSSATTELWT
jgi:hypothetical protein